jgi:hypothetical protein
MDYYDSGFFLSEVILDCTDIEGNQLAIIEETYIKIQATKADHRSQVP